MLTRLVTYVSSPGEFHSEKKFIVSLSSLHSLLASCTECGKPTSYEMTDQQGGFAEFTIMCPSCMHTRTWCTTPKLGNTYAVNVLVAACSLFTGSSATKVLRFLSSAGIAAPSYRTYLRHQKEYLHGVSSLFESLRHSKVACFCYPVKTIFYVL